MNNTITPKFEPSFQSIQHCCRLGTFANRNLSSTQLVEKAIQDSKLLQEYCNKNDVHMIMAAGVFSHCRKHLSYAAIEVRKLFPKNESTLLSKILNFFKKQPRESVVIHTYGDTISIAREELIRKINMIESKQDLLELISNKKRNPVVMKKCNSCGWNRDKLF